MARVKRRGGRRLRDAEGKYSGRADDGYWYAVFSYVSREDGAPHEKWINTGERNQARAYRRAQILEQQWRAEYAAGGEPRPNAGEPAPATPVGDLLDQWLEETPVAESTRRTYTETVRQYVRPYWEGTTAQDVDPKAVRKFVSHLRASTGARGGRLSPRIVTAALAALRLAMAMAVEQGTLDTNPCVGISAPTGRKRAVQALTREEQSRLLAAAETSRYRALWWLLVSEGLRIGEALALRWEDLQGDTLRVERTLDKRTRTVGPPKTASSVRTLSLDRRLVTILEEHRSRVSAEWSRRGDWRDEGWMFPSAVGTLVSYSSLVRREWIPLLKRASLPDYGIHCLRHTAATRNLLRGEPVELVSKRLGHSNPATTYRVYSHTVPGLQPALAKRDADDLFGEPTGNQKGLAQSAKPENP